MQFSKEGVVQLIMLCVLINLLTRCSVMKNLQNLQKTSMKRFTVKEAQYFESSLFWTKRSGKYNFLGIYKTFNITNSTRGGSRTAATSKIEHFLIIVNGWKPLTIITKSSILDIAAARDPPLSTNLDCQMWFHQEW